MPRQLHIKKVSDDEAWTKLSMHTKGPQSLVWIVFQMNKDLHLYFLPWSTEFKNPLGNPPHEGETTENSTTCFQNKVHSLEKPANTVICT